MRRSAFVFLALLTLSGCPSAPADAPESPTPTAAPAASPAASAGPSGAVSAALALRPPAEAFTDVARLVHAEGCAAAADCRTLPAGAKACGGPSRHVVYCSKTTDEAVLTKAIAEFTHAEREWNMANDVISDCAMKMPPELTLADGKCAAK